MHRPRFVLVATARRVIGNCGHTHKSRQAALKCDWEPRDSDSSTELVIQPLRHTRRATRKLVK